jgi:hypothetical protein
MLSANTILLANACVCPCLFLPYVALLYSGLFACMRPLVLYDLLLFPVHAYLVMDCHGHVW